MKIFKNTLVLAILLGTCSMHSQESASAETALTQEEQDQKIFIEQIWPAFMAWCETRNITTFSSQEEALDLFNLFSAECEEELRLIQQ